ncbi:hypothetical protein JXJ21_09060 [candidate division KSB1 bacterium]|nr:hypothetical protein [candidate division KSB1 bacterium]
MRIREFFETFAEALALICIVLILGTFIASYDHPFVEKGIWIFEKLNL